MQITLVRTGGIIPILKKASINVSFSNTEIDELINLIKVDDAPGKMRDHTQYQIIHSGKSFDINLEKVPQKYKETFESLKSGLKILKL